MDSRIITQVSEAEDKARVEAVLQEIPLPKEISKVTIELRNDATGDPAVYMSFDVDVSVRLERDDIARLSSYLTRVSFAVINSGISRFPYTYLNQAA